MGGTSEGAKKRTKAWLDKDPDYFSKLGKRNKRPKGGKHSPGSFTSETASRAGKKSKPRPRSG